MVVFGHFVFNSLFIFLYVTYSLLDILQFLSVSHLWIFRFIAHKSEQTIQRKQVVCFLPESKNFL